MNRIANADNIEALRAESERAFSAKVTVASPKEIKTSLHDDIKEKLRQIGQLQSYLSETECKLNGERLDVAWRRVAASVPQKVFEVQVSGNLYAAVAKLKKAHLLWNSQPFLVLQKNGREKADDLLAGPFHEIGQAVVIRDVESVEELYTRMTRADETRR